MEQRVRELKSSGEDGEVTKARFRHADDISPAMTGFRQARQILRRNPCFGQIPEASPFPVQSGLQVTRQQSPTVRHRQ
jgi:hypothetical protein